MGAIKGCCCGMLAGILLVLILSGAIALGVYLWMNPDARSNFVVQLEKGWGAAKDGGDKVMSEVKQVSGDLPAPSAAAPLAFPKPSPQPPPKPQPVVRGVPSAN